MIWPSTAHSQHQRDTKGEGLTRSCGSAAADISAIKRWWQSSYLDRERCGNAAFKQAFGKYGGNAERLETILFRFLN
jgi:hypothetical protein